jgi:hypothetical protein
MMSRTLLFEAFLSLKDCTQYKRLELGQAPLARMGYINNMVFNKNRKKS